MTHWQSKEYRTAYKREYERGERRYVDLEPVQAHIARLHETRGLSFAHIAASAGVSKGCIASIYAAERGQRHVQRTTAEKILAADGSIARGTAPSDETFVPNLGARRRIKALMAIGWSHREMLAHSGVYTAVLLHQRGEWVTLRNHRRVAAMFHQLAMTPGPSARARRYAAENGYPPPLAWDGNLDDPTAQPDPAAVAAATATTRHYAAVDLDEVRFLRTFGYSDDTIAERFGVTRGAIERAEYRALARTRVETEIAS